ncbi:MAG: TIGR00730 family Rossman fold protein [Desulfovibrionaceae bacterium]
MANGRQYPIDELSIAESWRLFKIMSEIVDGFESLGQHGPAVSIFGSARVAQGQPLYEKTRELATKLARAGFSIITGGGPGLMDAGNRGCQEGGGTSIGLHIHLPHEQQANTHLDVRCDFRYFFVRKLMFVKYATAYVVVPGGLGTLDELSEALLLIQTKRIKPFPIVLMGRDFWSGLLDWFQTRLLAEGFISEADLNLFLVTDDPDEAVEHIRTHAATQKEKARRAGPEQ